MSVQTCHIDDIAIDSKLFALLSFYLHRRGSELCPLPLCIGAEQTDTGNDQRCA